MRRERGRERERDREKFINPRGSGWHGPFG